MIDDNEIVIKLVWADNIAHLNDSPLCIFQENIQEIHLKSYKKKKKYSNPHSKLSFRFSFWFSFLFFSCIHVNARNCLLVLAISISPSIQRWE